MGLPPQHAPPLRAAALARPLHSGPSHRARPRQHLCKRVPSAQCRGSTRRGSFGEVVRTPEAVHRQRLARVADTIGGGRIAHRVAHRQHPDKRAAGSRTAQDTAHRRTHVAAEPHAAAAHQDRQRTIPRERRGRHRGPRARAGRSVRGDLCLAPPARHPNGRATSHGDDERVARLDHSKQPRQECLRTLGRGVRHRYHGRPIVKGAARGQRRRGAARCRPHLRPLLSGYQA